MGQATQNSGALIGPSVLLQPAKRPSSNQKAHRELVAKTCSIIKREIETKPANNSGKAKRS